MHPAYVCVGLFPATKRLHTEPADVDLARDTFYVIATRYFLDWHPALGAVLHIIVFLLLCKFFLSL